MTNFGIKLQINFANDVKQVMLDQLKKAGFIYNTKLEVDDLVRQYFNIRFREVEVRPRQVHISKELSAKLPVGDLKIGYDNIVALAKSGGHLNSYLSMELLKPDYKDPLLYDWRIHHFHLGTLPDKGDQRFITRTNELLYVRVEADDFYCIDILNHDPVNGFANKQLIEIIHQNWPQLIARDRFSNIPQPTGDLSNEQIDKIRQANVTAFVSTSDGTAYMPAGGGYATDGSSIMVTRQADILLTHIFSVEEAVKADDSSVRQAVVDRGIKCPRTIKVKLQGWDEQGVLAIEKKTDTKLRLMWPQPETD